MFEAALRQEIVRARRHAHGLAVILFNVDDMARLNRLHGFGAGDRLPERLGILSRRFFRTHDWVARHGGDAIAVLLPQTALDQATTLANRFREMVPQRIVLMDHKSEEASTVTVSAAAVGTDRVQAGGSRTGVRDGGSGGCGAARENERCRNRVEGVALQPTSVTIVGARDTPRRQRSRGHHADSQWHPARRPPRPTFPCRARGIEEYRSHRPAG